MIISSKSNSLTLLLALTTALGVGCAKDNEHHEAPAYYRTSEREHIHRADRQPEGECRMENGRRNENERREIGIKHIDDNRIRLESDRADLNQIELEKDSQGCFQNSQAGELRNIRVCQTDALITLHADRAPSPTASDEIGPLHLVMSRAKEKSASGLGLEKPQRFTLAELRRLVRSHSFKTREEYQKLLGAKANMRLHYLNLLPHVSFNSILSVSTGGPLGLVGAIGDLAPFLLPNRWAGAEENNRLYEAEKLSSAIIKEDAVNCVEGLALAVARDQKTLEELVKIRTTVPPILAQVNELEGRTPPALAPGRHRVVQSPLNLLDESIVSLEDVVDTDLTELATAMGFVNPLAIEAIDIGNMADITTAQIPNFAEIESATIRTSNEIPQITELIKGASANMKGRTFEWLDPAGDAQAGLGFGLPSYIEVAKRNMTQLTVAREGTHSILLKKARSAFVDLRMNLEQYKLSQQGIGIQSARIAADIEELKSSPNDTPIGDLQDSLEKLPEQASSLVTAQYGWYIAVSRLNRLTHKGPYEN